MNRARPLGTLIDVECKVVRETNDAIAITVEGRHRELCDRATGDTSLVDEWIWLPKKHIATRPGKVRVPLWLAKNRRLAA
jgi:hypothetical protein